MVQKSLSVEAQAFLKKKEESESLFKQDNALRGRAGR